MSAARRSRRSRRFGGSSIRKVRRRAGLLVASPSSAGSASGKGWCREALGETAQEFLKQPAHRLGLLLLHPMAGAIDEAAEAHLGASAVLHAFEVMGLLVDTPIAFAGDEAGGDIDGAARKKGKFLGVAGFRAAPIPVEAALKPGALEFAAVDAELRLG